MARISSQNMDKTYAFILIYVLMVFLWLLGHLLGKEVSIKKIETLNSFECPIVTRNDYDCMRFELEKNGTYPFFFESELPLFDVNISLRVFRQTGLNFNQDLSQNIKVYLGELALDSSGALEPGEIKEMTLAFTCKANEWICEPVVSIITGQLPKGKHYYVLEFADHKDLFKTIKNAEIIMESFDQEYQAYIIYFKLGMMILVLISTGLYFRTLKKVSSRTWSVEQIWVLYLSGAVLSMNDPLSLFYYKFGLHFLMFFSKLLMIFALSVILPFWICTLRALRLKQESRFLTFNETVFAGLNAFVATVCTLFFPDQPSLIFTIFKILNFAAGVVIVYQTFKNLSNIRKLLWVDKLFMLMTLYFAAAYLGLLYKWETPIDPESRNYAKSLALICLFTVYLLMCQYLYSARQATPSRDLDKSTLDRRNYDELQEDIEKNDFTQD